MSRNVKTIYGVKGLLSIYKDEINEKDNINIEQRNEIRKEFLENLYKFRDEFPHLLYPLYGNELLSDDVIKTIIENIKKHVQDVYSPQFPWDKFVDVVNGDIIETPQIIDFNVYKNSDLIIYDKYLDQFIISLLMSLPIGKIEFYIVDLESNFNNHLFCKKLNPKVYNNKFIKTESALKSLLDRLNKIKNLRRDKYGKYIEYCNENKSVPEPYIFVLLVDKFKYGYSDSYYGDDFEGVYKSFQKELVGLFKTTAKDGIYFIKKYKDKDIPIFEHIFDHDFIWGNYINRFIYFGDRDNDSMIRTFLHQYVKYVTKYIIIYHEHGPNAISYDSFNKPYFTFDYSRLISSYCGSRIYDKVRTGKIPCAIKEVDTLEKAKKIQRDLESFGARVSIKVSKNVVENSAPIVKCKNIIDNPKYLQACIDYINYEADSEERELLKAIEAEAKAKAEAEAKQKAEADAKAEAEAKYMQKYYIQDFESIVVPVGINSSNMVINFSMDLISHVHSFIIGQSGSGKSVFLHNVISSVVYKYAPEDLQLYLLDFKLGGVEFNRYRGVKHVKSLLVDNSDQQITLEILRELRDSMIERGRKLRDAGVNNLVEYNKKNPSATMPQILLVVDECHEMFRVGSDVPRIVSNEISEIVTKIAKEGRSQGVHLIMATQTLSGTEISSEILNNISDHYLLKCASVDSERMVERSTDITSKLSTGQIYYHHVDSQVTFQGYYIDKDNAELQIQKIKDKAKNHASNGEFYFNGSQLFQLNKNILESGKNQKYPTAYIGKNISIKQNDLSITLKKDFSENILLFGLNEQEQVTRTTMNVFLSLLYSTKCKGMEMDFKVFNCLSNDESVYTEQLEMLESKGLCEIIEGKKDRGCFLKQLAENVVNGTSNNTILLILGQERFRELKMDLDIADDKEQSSNDAFGFGEFNFGSSSSSSSLNTFRKALETILDKGPETGVHVIMQLDKPSNFLFSDYISSKLVYQKFKHLIMLKSDEAASSQLGLNDNVRLENLSRDLERLRAYYYAEESDTYTLFTPYMESSKEEIVKLLNL